MEGNPMNTVPDGAVDVALTSPQGGNGFPACGDRPSIL